MAALLETAPFPPEIRDLRRMKAADLDSILEQESGVWREELDWDFEKSADLVRRFVDLRALNGFALMQSSEVIGYAYSVSEDHKGLIGDLYIREGFETPANLDRLLGAVLEALIATPQVRRIESQLMMIGDKSGCPLPGQRYLETFERDFMVIDLAARMPLPPARVKRRVSVERWAEHHQEPAARLIADSYVGHVDGRINDQYRSVAGARRFLYNIVQYPGCGDFFRPASLVSYDLETGRLCGISLVSLVGPAVGHITQICVAPFVRGTCLGYELLRQSLAALRERGCTRTSLTVTSSNLEAIRLYLGIGFKTVRKFSAYVWEGF